MAREVAAAKEMVLRAEEERDCNWVFEIFGILGSEIWTKDILGLQVGAPLEEIESGDKGFDEAMITLAMADSDAFSGSCESGVFVSVMRFGIGEGRGCVWAFTEGLSLPLPHNNFDEGGVVEGVYPSGTRFTRVSLHMGVK